MIVLKHLSSNNLFTKYHMCCVLLVSTPHQQKKQIPKQNKTKQNKPQLLLQQQLTITTMLFHPHQAISLCPPLLPCHASLSRHPYFPSQLPFYTIRPARLRNVARISHLPSKPTSKNPDKSRQTTLKKIPTNQLPATAPRLFDLTPPPLATGQPH